MFFFYFCTSTQDFLCTIFYLKVYCIANPVYNLLYNLTLNIKHLYKQYGNKCKKQINREWSPLKFNITRKFCYLTQIMYLK